MLCPRSIDKLLGNCSTIISFETGVAHTHTHLLTQRSPGELPRPGDDTIGIFACGLLLLHVILYDYGDGSSASVWSCQQELFLPGGPIALNASVLSAMILASRLRTPLEVFAFMSFAMEVFALPHFCGRSTACVLPLLFAVAIALDFKSGVSLVLAGILIGFVGPVLFLSAQNLKTEIQGPWDIAHVLPEPLEGTSDGDLGHMRLGNSAAACLARQSGSYQSSPRYVVPTLLPGMNAVAEERPENPVEWLAYYLLKNNTMGKKPSEEKKADDAAPEQ
ncbi:pigC [Symbiodinium necroappetens]|uniref:PigC protein n=1 Tax=Symbiodinium necroappetens TaxID=1628268 RepID=A0A812P2E8_9DINO|nr:pigC [Symbiodinium necroappetens]